jgi:hypothetical protein
MSLNLGIIASSKSPSAPLLLDTYSGAAAAYSLRKLRSAYTGAAIRVRRSSDNTETDIGFVSNQLDTTSLLSFVGANNGFVTKWYDQSGNARDTSQGTTTKQPQIVSSGTLILTNSKPAITFDGSSSELITSSIASYLSSTAYSIFSTNKANTIKSDGYFIGTSGTLGLVDKALIVGYRSSSQITISHYLDDANFSYTQNVSQLSHSAFYKATGSEYFINNASIGTSTSPSNSLSITDGNLQLGRAYGNGSLYFNGNIQECILYTSNQLSNRTGINSNINTYYSIYTPQWSGNGTALLDLYPSASVAYSLRNLSSTYTGPLVRVRRSSDNTEQDIYGLFNGQLDTTSLTAFCGAGSGYVKTWYDQSGNAKHLTQNTTSLQPEIVRNSVINLLSGKPCVTFSPLSSISKMTAIINIAQPVSVFVTSFAPTNIANYVTILSTANSANTDSGIEIDLSTPIAGVQTALYSGAILSDNTIRSGYCLMSTLSNGANSYIYFNNGLVASGNAGTNDSNLLCLGRNWSDTATYNNIYQEIVIYNANQTTNRAAINTNINSYYSVYVSDTDAQEFINRVAIAGGTLNQTEKNAVNQLVLNLKSAGIWTSMKAIYPMVGSSAAACAQNLKSSSFTGTFTSGWTFSSGGATPNGTSAYMNTGFIESINSTLSNQHISVYLRTNVIGLQCDIGAENSDFNVQSNIFSNYNGALYSRIHGENSGIAINYSTLGLFTANRVTSTQVQGWKNTDKNILSDNSVGLPTVSLYIGSSNKNNSPLYYSTRQNAFSSIGDGLTDTQVSDLYTIVQSFQTSLSRQV